MITFESPITDGREHYQDIMKDGICIGALWESERGLLQPITTVYQYCAAENDQKKESCDFWYNTEDDGYVFYAFYNLDDFLNHVD